MVSGIIRFIAARKGGGGGGDGVGRCWCVCVCVCMSKYIHEDDLHYIYSLINKEL